MDCWTFFQPLSADIAKFALDMSWLGPTMSDRILDEAGSDARARSYNIGDTFLMNDEIAGWKCFKMLILCAKVRFNCYQIEIKMSKFYTTE